MSTNEIIRQAPDGWLYCARPDATASWDEWLADYENGEKIAAAWQAARAERDAISDRGSAEWRAADAKAQAVLTDDTGKNEDRSFSQYALIESAEERAARLTWRLRTARILDYRCRQPAGSGSGARCGSPVIAFLADPAGPDEFTCGRHAGTWPVPAAQLAAQVADLEWEITRSLDLESGLAEMRELGAELAAAGRCGVVVPWRFYERYTQGHLCLLAAGHDGECSSGARTIPGDGARPAAEAERELERIQAVLARLTEREQARQVAEQERVLAARFRGDAERRARWERATSAPAPEPGTTITLSHPRSHWDREAGKMAEDEPATETLTVTGPAAGSSDGTPIVPVAGKQGRERYLARSDTDSWYDVCGTPTARRGERCRGQSGWWWDRKAEAVTYSASQACGTHRKAAS